MQLLEITVRLYLLLMKSVLLLMEKCQHHQQPAYLELKICRGELQQKGWDVISMVPFLLRVTAFLQVKNENGLWKRLPLSWGARISTLQPPAKKRESTSQPAFFKQFVLLDLKMMSVLTSCLVIKEQDLAQTPRACSWPSYFSCWQHGGSQRRWKCGGWKAQHLGGPWGCRGHQAAPGLWDLDPCGGSQEF